MSSRVLRKLQAEKELVEEISDTETDTPVGGTRKKQLNINRYDLLNQQSYSESEVKEDDNETEAPMDVVEVNQELKRKKKKKKKKGKYVNTQRSSEENPDIDEVERSVREVNKLLGETYDPNVSAVATSQKFEKINLKGVLHVQHKHLNANNELKRIFGSRIIQTEQKRKNRGSRTYTKAVWMSNCKENWPQVGKSGISMNLLETKDGVQYFAYEHSHSYMMIQHRFLDAVESLNPNNIVAIINEYPYHIDALIQLSDLCKLSEDFAMAAELIERALYCLESAFHPLFNVSQGNCRLEYRRQENRALYITAFKHMMFVGARACCRTSLEFCKLILSMDPENDPLAIILAMDFYALRAKEYNWLKDFVAEWEGSKNLSQLPNFAFSIAVAHFYTCNGDTKKADSLLQDALIMFPGVLKPLLEKCSIQPDSRVASHDFFSRENKGDPPNLQQLISLYVHRSFHIWKDSDLLPWLEKNVQEVLDRVDAQEEFVQECEEKRSKRYQGPLPINVARHIILSDFKGLSPITEESNSHFMSFDPLPPKDSINIYSKPKKLISPNQASNPMVVFVRSIFPNFNPTATEQNGDEAAGAVALPAENAEENNGIDGEFRRTVATMLSAMRYLLNNIRPEADADVDENDETDEDYLTDNM
ncbi:transcription factor 25 isoform X2 [Coccinella septempunctata]|uniref:transcription factor 25 isoform X2 n=1 Tax=Coccinella septempunctata TaxID=41139 RepID=UPI001D08339A|nr:transcription factor 25 isoform X2 [Coccinella septempunctata]